MQQMRRKLLLSQIFFFSASTIRPLLPLILLQTISFVNDPSPTIYQRRSFAPSDCFLRREFITKHPSSKYPSSFVNIFRQFRTRHFPSFVSLIQAESKEMVFIQIIAPEVSFPTQKESAQSNTCSSRYL